LIQLLELDRGECLRLLRATNGRVGRIAVNVPGSPPMLRPVNYVFDDEAQSVVFRCAPGSELHRTVSSATALFEIDGGDPVERAGWSVIVVGEAEEVTDSAEIDRLEDLELEPWAPGPRVHWVRIRATSATGRRIVRAPDTVPDHGA
jgi:nitroimidazol reductase NimA-like FMN-containing flavoprotein (pyridoxamine 5'-phosphate oxidase superfamily)